MNDRKHQDPQWNAASRMPGPEEQYRARGAQHPVDGQPAQLPEQQPSAEPGGRSQHAPYPPPGAAARADSEDLKRASLFLRIGGIGKILIAVYGLISALVLIFLPHNIPGIFMTEDLSEGMRMIEDMQLGFLLTGLAIVSLIFSILTLWFGIVAVRHHRDERKIGFLFTVGILFLIQSVYGVISAFAISSVINLLVSAAYFNGARLKRKHYQP